MVLRQDHQWMIGDPPFLSLILETRLTPSDSQNDVPVLREADRPLVHLSECRDLFAPSLLRHVDRHRIRAEYQKSGRSGQRLRHGEQ